MKRNPST